MKIKVSQDFVKHPLVSIIIPSYNRYNTIGETIDSILKQDCSFNFEIIIGDDFSTYDVRELLEYYQDKYPEKIKLLFNDKNYGLGANWATCVKHSRGKYIAGCDNDDYWHNPDKLKLQVKFLEEHPEYGMIHTNYREFNGKNQLIDKIVHEKKYSDTILNSIYFGGFICCNSSAMYRKSVIDKHINLDDYIKYQFPLCDWNTWLLIAKHTMFYCLPTITTTVRKEIGSITRPTDYNAIIDRLSKEKNMHQYLRNKLGEDFEFNESYYDIYIYTSLLNLAYNKYDYSKAKTFAIKLQQLGSTNLKVKVARNKIMFELFVYIKRKFTLGNYF